MFLYRSNSKVIFRVFKDVTLLSAFSLQLLYASISDCPFSGSTKSTEKLKKKTLFMQNIFRKKIVPNNKYLSEGLQGQVWGLKIDPLKF